MYLFTPIVIIVANKLLCYQLVISQANRMDHSMHTMMNHSMMDHSHHNMDHTNHSDMDHSNHDGMDHSNHNHHDPTLHNNHGTAHDMKVTFKFIYLSVFELKDIFNISVTVIKI